MLEVIVNQIGRGKVTSILKLSILKVFNCGNKHGVIWFLEKGFACEIHAKSQEKVLDMLFPNNIIQYLPKILF